ncbi:response regulator [Clostridium sp. LBM24168]
MIKILIVDDSIFSQKITSNLIKKFMNNVELFFACDGIEGFKLYRKIMPDYVFLDLLMPNLNGRELIKLIKEYNNSARIIVISADVQKNVKEEIKNYNIVSFINKPFNEEKAKDICNIIKNKE